MKAAILYDIRDIRVQDVSIPSLGPNDVLIKVKSCGICGTDIHFYKGEWRVKLPLIPGHEFSGVVEEVGEKVKGVNVGDHVVAEPNITCGECYYCRMSERNFFCTELKALGVDIDGAYAEYVKAPSRNVYKIPNELSFEEAAMIEPLACCIRGLDNIGIKIGERVAIVGTGPIGLLLIQLVKMWGATKVYAMDLLDERLKIAEKVGADVIINPLSQDPRKVIMKDTNGVGVDVSIEAAGSVRAIETAFSLVRKGGKLLIFGVAPQDAVWHVKPFELYDKELKIAASYRSPFTFERAIEISSTEKIDFKSIISHVISLDEVPEIFKRIDRRESGIVKVIIKP